MIMRIAPGKVSGKIQAISSKSHVHRLLICAALSHNPTKVRCRDVSQDIACTVKGLRALCADIFYENDYFIVNPRMPKEEALINCGESGSTYRFLLPVAAALGGKFTFKLQGRLPHRPMDIFYDLLNKNGVKISGAGTELVSIEGKLSAAHYEIAGNISSQYITGLMLCAPLIEEDVKITLATPLQSAAYADITMDVQRQFLVYSFRDEDHVMVSIGAGYQSPGEVDAQGDWSNAAFWLSAAAAGGSRLSVRGLDANSAQGDKAILEMLKRFGCKISINNDIVTVEESNLQGCVIDIDATPDLAPEIAMLGLAAKGATSIQNISRLRLKESDRAASITQTLQALGGEISLEQDAIHIRGTGVLRGGTCSGHSDHRIVMMAACAAVFCEQDVLIEGAQAVDKSYPRFFKDLQTLGMSAKEEE
ncbi:MAG: 3-phosphoshikimate 1-carboxyvinyltransferase [Clostridiales bacterium]|nr:3-phosphoshikimate 1-carboxyvinyltransferase [Clostridiales bacterium]